MVTNEDVFNMAFYNKKKPFTGSVKKIRYRIIKQIEETENGEKTEKFFAWVWKDRFCFEVTPEEVDEELKTMAAQYQMTPEKVKELIGDNIKYMEKDLKTRKAVDFIFDNAVIK